MAKTQKKTPPQPTNQTNYLEVGDTIYIILYQAFRDENGNIKTSKFLIPQGQELGTKFVAKAIGFPEGYSTFVSDAIGEVVVEGTPELVLKLVAEIKHRDFLPVQRQTGFRTHAD